MRRIILHGCETIVWLFAEVICYALRVDFVRQNQDMKHNRITIAEDKFRLPLFGQT